MAYDTVILGDTPTVYYRLDGTVGRTVDSSGNGHTLTPSGSNFTDVASLTSDGANGACLFDTPTAAGHLDLADSTALKFTGTSAFSIECWLRPITLNASFRRVCGWSDEAGAGTEGYNLTVQNTSVMLTRRQAGTDRSADWTFSAVAGRRAYMLGTYDGSNLRLYWDGVLRRTVADANSITSYGGTFRIGQGQFASSGLNSEVDELAIYNYCLTDAQAWNHYAAGVSTALNPKRPSWPRRRP